MFKMLKLKYIVRWKWLKDKNDQCSKTMFSIIGDCLPYICISGIERWDVAWHLLQHIHGNHKDFFLNSGFKRFLWMKPELFQCFFDPAIFIGPPEIIRFVGVRFVSRVCGHLKSKVENHNSMRNSCGFHRVPQEEEANIFSYIHCFFCQSILR